jgi:hypothetical protein
MTPEREFVGTVTGALGAIVLSFLLVTVRGAIVNANANAALALVVPVVLGAVMGGRWAGFASAVTAALCFDFFFARPYGSLKIADHDDVETLLILLVVALIAAEIGLRGRHASTSAQASKSEVDRLYRVAELGARTSDPADVILAVQAELIGLFELEDCEYEAVATDPLPVLERNGTLRGVPLALKRGEFALPATGIEVAVTAHGRDYGRLVLRPDGRAGASLEQRRVAVALADELALVFASARAAD